AGGEGSQAIIPYVIVEKGLSGTTFEIPRLPTAVGILGMTKSLVWQSPLIEIKMDLLELQTLSWKTNF
ncbi:MAG TPA: hypothetical protein VE868_00015, partial [Balneolaceae bacterium]|nr:hypothetical protein [Balneolaceae bacterium]